MPTTLSNVTVPSQASGRPAASAAEPTSWLQNLSIAIEVVCPAIALSFVLLRYAIRSQLRVLGWDDGFIFLAMVLSIALTVATIFIIKLNYIGIHYYDIPPQPNFTAGLIWSFIGGIIYNPVLAFVKQSVLIFILRIAEVEPRVLLICRLTSVFNMAEMVAVLFVVIFQCSPVESFWQPDLGQKCINQEAFSISTGILTILTDIVVVVLPFWVFQALQMNKKMKVALIGVFSLGLLVTVVSIIRLYYVYIVFTSKNPDINFSLGTSIAAIECNLAIVTASAPTLWPLVRRIKAFRTGSSSHDAEGRPHAHHGRRRKPSSHSLSGLSGSYPARFAGDRPLLRNGSVPTIGGTPPGAGRRPRERRSYDTSVSTLTGAEGTIRGPRESRNLALVLGRDDDYDYDNDNGEAAAAAVTRPISRAPQIQMRFSYMMGYEAVCMGFEHMSFRIGTAEPTGYGAEKVMLHDSIKIPDQDSPGESEKHEGEG